MAMAALARRRILQAQCSARRMATAATPQEAPPPPQQPVVRNWAGRIMRLDRAIGNLFHARVEYKREVLSLRRKYREEVARQKAEEDRKAQAEKELLLKAREEKAILKEQRREEARLHRHEKVEELRVILEEQRLHRAERFKKEQAEVTEKRARAKLKVRQVSCSWIEEKDLEMRILEAMVEPVRLIGTTSTPKLDSFETVASSRSSKAKEDPLLRDSDDELLSAFSKKPKVTGQDILASVSKATTKLQF